jgi:hypothetical protein
VAALQARTARASAEVGGSYGIGKGGLELSTGLAWLAVGIPILWGVWKTLDSAVAIFK